MSEEFMEIQLKTIYGTEDDEFSNLVKQRTTEMVTKLQTFF